MFSHPDIHHDEDSFYSDKLSPSRKEYLLKLFNDESLPSTSFRPLLASPQEEKKELQRKIIDHPLKHSPSVFFIRDHKDSREEKERKVIVYPRRQGEVSSKYIMTALSGASAVSEAIGLGLGMDDMNPGEKILGFIPNSSLTKKIIPILFFLEYVTIYCTPAIENMQETVQALLSGESLSDWPQISNSIKKVIAHLTGAFPAFFNAFSDCVNTFYYTSEQQWHPIIGVGLSIASLLTSVFSEGFETIKKAAELFADTAPSQAQSNEAPLLTYAMKLLGLIGAFEEAIESYAAIAATFSTRNSFWHTFFFTGSSSAAICSYVFGIKTTIDAAKFVYNKLLRGTVTPYEVLGFTLALFTGALLGHIQRAFFLTMLAKPEITLPFQLNSTVKELVSWGVATNGALYNVIGLTPFFSGALKKLSKRREAPEDIELTDLKAADFEIITPEEQKEAQEEVEKAEWDFVQLEDEPTSSGMRPRA